MNNETMITDFGVAVVVDDWALSKYIINDRRLDVSDDEISSLKPHIPEGSIVLDIGACLGSHSASYSKFVGPTGFVHSFEPHDIAYKCLEHNMKAYNNVATYNLALGSKEGTGSTVRLPNLGASRNILDVDGTVSIWTLDKVCRYFDKVDFIKLDVEGSEPEVLDGAKETINRFRPIMLIEVNKAQLEVRGMQRSEIYNRLNDLKYTYVVTNGLAFEDDQIDILCFPGKR